MPKARGSILNYMYYDLWDSLEHVARLFGNVQYSVHGFLVLSSGVPNATQDSVISKTVWVAKTVVTIAPPNIAGAVETVETVETVWGQ